MPLVIFLLVEPTPTTSAEQKYAEFNLNCTKNLQHLEEFIIPQKW